MNIRPTITRELAATGENLRTLWTFRSLTTTGGVSFPLAERGELRRHHPLHEDRPPGRDLQPADSTAGAKTINWYPA